MADIDRERPSDQSPQDADGPPRDAVPNPETGVGIGAGDANSFEPEEDPDAAETAR